MSFSTYSSVSLVTNLKKSNKKGGGVGGGGYFFIVQSVLHCLIVIYLLTSGFADR